MNASSLVLPTAHFQPSSSIVRYRQVAAPFPGWHTATTCCVVLIIPSPSMAILASPFGGTMAGTATSTGGSRLAKAPSLSTGATFFSLKQYFEWNFEHSSCDQRAASGELGFDRVAESALKKFAQDLQASPEINRNPLWDISITAAGRTLSYSYRFKRSLDTQAFYNFLSEYQTTVLKGHCSDDNDFVLRFAKATETHTFYNPDGERLTSYSISPGDCGQW
jgi:hypothetical protein